MGKELQLLKEPTHFNLFPQSSTIAYIFFLCAPIALWNGELKTENW